MGGPTESPHPSSIFRTRRYARELVNSVPALGPYPPGGRGPGSSFWTFGWRWLLRSTAVYIYNTELLGNSRSLMYDRLFGLDRVSAGILKSKMIRVVAETETRAFL